MSLSCIFLLPSEASKTIIQYQPSFKISCVIPPGARKILARFDNRGEDERGIQTNLEVKHPALLWTHSFQFYQVPYSHQFALNALNENEESKVLVKPYRLANVHDNAAVCFGNELFLANLRQAHNSYWDATFTDDTWDDEHEDCDNISHEYYDHCEEEELNHICNGLAPEDHKCKCAVVHLHPEKCDGTKACKCCPCYCCVGDCACEPEHLVDCLCIAQTCSCSCACKCCTNQCDCACNCRCCTGRCECTCDCDMSQSFFDHIRNYATMLESQTWEDWTPTICGTRFIATSQKTQGVFISNHPDIVNRLPTEYVKRHNERPYVVGFANRSETTKSWIVNLGKTTIQFPLSSAIIITE